MHTYIRDNRDNLWVVGFYKPLNGEPGAKWYPIRDFATEQHAAAFVNFLNGGEGTIETSYTFMLSTTEPIKK